MVYLWESSARNPKPVFQKKRRKKKNRKKNQPPPYPKSHSGKKSRSLNDNAIFPYFVLFSPCAFYPFASVGFFHHLLLLLLRSSSAHSFSSFVIKNITFHTEYRSYTTCMCVMYIIYIMYKNLSMVVY